jgi:hypothetical protein
MVTRHVVRVMESKTAPRRATHRTYGMALAVLAVAALSGAYLTRGHRGVSNTLAGLELEIDDD